MNPRKTVFSRIVRQEVEVIHHPRDGDDFIQDMATAKAIAKAALNTYPSLDQWAEYTSEISNGKVRIRKQLGSELEHLLTCEVLPDEGR